MSKEQRHPRSPFATHPRHQITFLPIPSHPKQQLQQIELRFACPQLEMLAMRRRFCSISLLFFERIARLAACNLETSRVSRVSAGSLQGGQRPRSLPLLFIQRTPRIAGHGEFGTHVQFYKNSECLSLILGPAQDHIDVLIQTSCTRRNITKQD